MSLILAQYVFIGTFDHVHCFSGFIITRTICKNRIISLICSIICLNLPESLSSTYSLIILKLSCLVSGYVAMLFYNSTAYINQTIQFRKIST